jgi:hypothetical protein
MRSVKNYYSLFILTMVSIFAFSQTATAQGALSAEDGKTLTEFENQAKAYSRMREDLEAKLPKMPKDATADQIETHKVTFQKLVLQARAGAKQGEIFTPAAGVLIRKIIKTEFGGKDGADLRKTVLEAENKDVAVKVNVAYPDSKEQVEMPPALLLVLPQLPKQLRYRFVGTNLLLVDRENGLIIDYLTNALP